MKKQRIFLSNDNHEVAKWIWKNLVPKRGEADSIQGEMLRAIERLRWEAQQNGNINWGELYIEFIDFLQQSFISEEKFSNEVKESIMHDLNRLRNFIFPEDFKDREDAKNNGPYIDDDLYNRLIDHLIDYCRIHQIIIPLEK